MKLGLGLGFNRQGSGGYNPAALFAAVTATPSFVYGTVKMVAAYSGPAIRVFRPSDSAEVDIGFTGNRLNETALFAHLGAQTGQIVRWYDQSGAGNHTDAQTDSARRATIGPNYRQGGNLITHHNATTYTLPAGLSFDRRNSSFYTASGGRNGPGQQAGIWRVGSSGDPYFLTQNGRAIQTAANTTFYPVSRFVSEFHLSATGAVRGLNEMLDTNTALSAGTETGGTFGTADSGFFLSNDHDIFVGYNTALSTPDRAAVKAALSAAFGGIVTAGPRILFVGDSISAGVGDPRGFGYSARAAQLVPYNCYGASEGGQQIVNFVANYNTGLARAILLAYPAQPRVVFLMMGTNDLTIGGRTAAQIYADLQAYCGLVRADGAQVIIGTILPNNGWNGTQQAIRNDLNASIRANWASFADGLCDFAADPVMGPQAAAANATLYGDGLHPAAQGHQNLAVLAATAINGLFFPFAPSISGVPTIGGGAVENQTLTATAAPISGIPVPVRTWQWQRNGVDISGATSSTYTLVTADVGTTIRVRQTETNSQGSASATSASTATIAPSAGFTPADLFSPGVVGAWSSRVTTADLWQDVARTTPVTAAGQPVGSWRVNTSSGVIYMQQSTAGARPTYQIDGNGVPHLRFDGLDDQLDSSVTFALSGNTESTMMVAADHEGSFADNKAYITHNPEVLGGFARIVGQNGTGTMKVDVVGTNTTAPAIPTTFAVLEGRFGGTEIAAAVNGGAFTTVTGVTITTRNNTGLTLGKGAVAQFADYRCYGFVHVVRTLTAGERSNLVAWMTALGNP